MDKMYLRTSMLIGTDKIKKLQSKHVAVFGIGGVGGYVVEALVRAGVGRITIIDYDVVDETNINRQIIALRSTIGQSKVDVMKERIYDINPNIYVNTMQIKLSEENIHFIDFKSLDYVVDAIDDVTAKLLLVEYAGQLNVPIISSMGTGNKLDPLRLEISDIKKTSVCPLARVIRKELRARGIESLKVLYSKEEPIKISDNSARVPASISFVPASAGLIIASEVVKELIQ